MTKNRNAFSRISRGAGLASAVMLLLAPPVQAYEGMPALSFSGGKTSGPIAAAYDLALKNLIDINTVSFDVAKDRTGLIAPPSNIVQAGADYPVSQGQIWTRDSSINVMSAASLLEPKVARDTLWADCDRQKSDNELILYQQDGQFWDRIIWISAAWHHFEVTNDAAFLTDAYQTAENSLTAAENAYRNATYGLFKGPSHINDGIAGYPSPPANDPEVDSASFDNSGVVAMMALSTNVIYYAAYQDAAAMADALGRPSPEATALRAKAVALKTAINSRFWLPSAGRYGYFIGGTGALTGQLDPSQEALGLSLALLYGIPSADQAASIVSNVAIAPRGITDIYPSFPRYDNTHPGRHNMSVWPYIQGVWAYAMAAVGNEPQFRAETERMAYLVTSPVAASNQQFYEIYNFQTGLFDGGWQTGSSWGSAHNQTWSATGFLRAIYEGLFGMRFTPSALEFAPVLPVGWGDASLQGVNYRSMTLNIQLTGAGNSIASFQLDGQVMTAAQVPGNLTGTHQVEISLTNAFSNLARDAVATSSPTAADYPGTAGVNDGKINGFLDDANPSPDFKAGSPASGLNLGDERQSEWVSSSDNKNSAWVQLDWSTTQSVQMVRLFDRINTTDHITGGTLSFSDGSTVAVTSLPNDGFSAFEARFTAKMIHWVRFTINATSDSTFEPGLAEFEVLGTEPGAAPDADGGVAVTDAGLAGASSATGGASAGGASAGGKGGASGSAASGSSGVSGGSPAKPNGTTGTSSGCGCSTPGSSSPRTPGSLVLLSVGALVAARRRRVDNGRARRPTFGRRKP
jgi:MYXO-CTERM domain-containing protein